MIRTYNRACLQYTTPIKGQNRVIPRQSKDRIVSYRANQRTESCHTAPIKGQNRVIPRQSKDRIVSYRANVKEAAMKGHLSCRDTVWDKVSV